MGRWSRRLAHRFVPWLNVPAGVHWLDVGCGTGALTNAICADADPASVTGCDPADTFIEFARRETVNARVTFVVAGAGAGALPRRADRYGSVSSMLALNFFPDARAAVEEMRSLTAGNGVVSACVWDYGGRMEFLRRFWDTASTLDPAAAVFDEGARFPLCRPEVLEDLFRAGGLVDIRCEPIDIPTDFASFDDYWRPLLGGTGPAPSYVASLDTGRRTALARKLEQELLPGFDGSIRLTARSWAIRGTADS